MISGYIILIWTNVTITLMILAMEMKKETAKSIHAMISIAKLNAGVTIVEMSANLVLSDTNLASLKNLTLKEKRGSRNQSFKR